MSERAVTVLLTDIQEATEAIQRYITGINYDSFMSNALVRDAVVRNIQVIGEAANRIPNSFRDEHPTIEWMRIIRTRHILVHDYFGLDYQIIRRIITVHLPPLQTAVQTILSNEFSDGPDTEQP